MRRASLFSLATALLLASTLAAPALTKGEPATQKTAAPQPAAAKASPKAEETPALPGGSWAKTCGNPVMNAFELTATCSAANAPPATSTVDITDCAQPALVGVRDGKLVCENGSRQAPAGGAWTASCIGESVQGKVVTASCLAGNGKLLESSIDLTTCAAPGDLVADNGKLACAIVDEKPVAAAQPAAEAAPAAKREPKDFAGDWDIKTERGDALRLTMKIDGARATGSVPFKKDTLTFTGHVDDDGKLQLVWQLARLTGTGTLELLEDGTRLKGVIILADGGAVAGGTWDSKRAAAATAAALPLGETGAKVDGFVDGTVTGTVVVRNGPSSKGTRILATLQRGDKVSVKCAPNGWCELAEGDRYVARSFVKLDGDPSPKAATAAPKPAVKKVVVVKKKPAAKEAPPPNPGFLGVPGLIITFGHKNQQSN
ncbi:MAG: hypothetical protein J0H94_05655 [Rhizobiales bacterium]|nr:hypothetical protein [Hyphomicrobiales bacterium]